MAEADLRSGDTVEFGGQVGEGLRLDLPNAFAGQPEDATADSILVYHLDGKITTITEGLQVVFFLSRATLENSKKTGSKTGVLK